MILMTEQKRERDGLSETQRKCDAYKLFSNNVNLLAGDRMAVSSVGRNSTEIMRQLFSFVLATSKIRVHLSN